jgi:LysR family transcriptional regulator, benzoate and cis,cis-muconate-responsive activator of ben and cat genes
MNSRISFCYVRALDLLAHLEAFEAVAERRSFSAAAEHLHIAQPLLSRRIKNLEQRLGGRLFERSQRQVRITELGELLLPHTEEILVRTGHLLALAESAQRTTVLAVGIPPDCDPTSLARLLTGASQHGTPIAVHESPAPDRAAALEAGRFDCALLRVRVESAELVARLGLAEAPGAESVGVSVHLDSLRPRRRAGAAPPVRLLVMPEDDLPLHTDRLTRGLAAAGLSGRCIAAVSSASTAVAEVLAGDGRLICDERFAKRHRLSWTPLADPGLHRGYELSVNSSSARFASLGPLRASLLPLLAASTGAAPVAAAAAPPTPSQDQRRLAAGV